MEFSGKELFIIELFRIKGSEDSGAREIFNEWLKEEQVKADKSETSKARIELDFKCAKLYSAIGDKEAALSILNDMLEFQEGEDIRAQVLELIGGTIKG